MERQPGQLPQPPERVEDGPVRQLVTVEVEQPAGGVTSALAFSLYLRFRGKNLGGKIIFFETENVRPGTEKIYCNPVRLEMAPSVPTSVMLLKERSSQVRWAMLE